MLYRFTLMVSLVAVCSCDGSSSPSDALVASCPPITGAGTSHTSVTASETWTAEASPHVIESQLDIPAGAIVTVEACAVVRLGATGILVEGALVATGIEGQPVTFERLAAATPWQHIEVRQGGTLALAYTNLTGGGDPAGGPVDGDALIDVRGDQLAATQPAFIVDHVAITGSGSLGVRLREGGGFAPSSTALAITGAASYPISAWGRAAGTIPAGTYTGNAQDAVFIPALGGYDDVQDDATFANLGVPYLIGGQLVVRGDGRLTTLTIASGTTVRFATAARLVVDAPATTDPASGALVADGVTFTSAAAVPAAGDWVGLIFRGTPSPTSAIAHARIEFAGAPSQASSFGCPSALATDFSDDGAIVILGNQPAAGFVTTTTIASSAGDGVVRGWTGDEVDFAASNTFSDVARCQQTFPKPTAGVCPSPAPCVH